MKSAKAVLAFIVVGALVGCDKENTSASASAEPGKTATSTSQATSAKPSGEPAGKAAAQQDSAGSGSAVAKEEAKAGAGTGLPAETAAPAPGPTGATAVESFPLSTDPPLPAAQELLKHMPKECGDARAYVNVGKILTTDALGVLEQWAAQQVAESKDPKKSEEVLKTLRNGGIEPLKGLKQLAVCGNKDDKLTVVAVNMDMSKADKPADVLAKAIEVATGKAPKKEVVDGVTYLQDEGAGKWLAVIGKDTLLAGRSKELLQAAAKGPGGEKDFADAASHVIWANVTDKQVQVRVREVGEAFDVKAKWNAGPNAPKQKAEFDKIIPALDKVADKMPMIKPLIPTVKGTKLEAKGETLVANATLTKAAMNEFLNGLKGMKLEDIKKQIPLGR